MKKITAIFLTVAILLSMLGILTMADVAYGTKNNPLVNNADSTPIVVGGESLTFPDGMQIKDNAKFTASIDSSKLSSSTATLAYSDAVGAYYGDTAGSLAATINSCTSSLAGKTYATAQFRDDFCKVQAGDVANSSFAFWMNAPEKMNLRVWLFAYRHSGDSGDIGFYSEEIVVDKGENIVEIPFANFTVSSNNSVDPTKNLTVYAARFLFRSVENGEDIVGKTVYVDNLGLYFEKNTLSDYVTPYGTKGYPLVENNSAATIVVNDNTAAFPDGMQIKDNAKFTASIDSSKLSSSTATLAYSGAAGSYYGDTAGSLAVTVNSCTTPIEGKNYATAQYNEKLAEVTPEDAANSSFAFWINAPTEMYVRVWLFSYGYGGSDNAERSFYSSDIKVSAGANLVEIPLANFTVVSTGAVDLTKNIKIFASRFCFRSVENGEDIVGKTVYVDNLGLYFDMNAMSDYIQEYGTKGNPVVDGPNKDPLVVVQDGNKDFPEGMNINDATTFTGNAANTSTITQSAVVDYSNTQGTYYGSIAGSVAAQLKTFAVPLAGANYSAMQYANNNSAFAIIPAADVSKASVAFWIDAPEKMNLRVQLFAYRHSGDSGDIGFYSSEIVVEKGVSFVEIPLANFTVSGNNSIDATKDIKVYAARFHFRSVENGEDLTDKTVYIDNIGFYNQMNTASSYNKAVNNEYGTKGNPVVDGPNKDPIVVVQNDNTVFPEGMVHKDLCTFTGNATDIKPTTESTEVGYSDVAGTYYGAVAGSVSAKFKTFAVSIEGANYSAMQFGNANSAFATIPADNISNASVAFWVNAPADMYLRLTLFSYGYGGTDNKERSYYSSEIRVSAGANFVEIPLANFTVSSNVAVDLTKDIKVFASRFHFRSVENGEDLTDKTVYIDNIGFYNQMNTASSYNKAVNNEYGTKGNPVVDGPNKDPIVVVQNDNTVFPEGMVHKDLCTFTGNATDIKPTTESTEVGYSDVAGTYYGAVAGSVSAKFKTFAVSIEGANYSAMQFGNANSAFATIPADNISNASVAFWVNAPADMYLRLTLFSYGYGGTDNKERSYYSSEIRVSAGANFVEIPLANFTVSSNVAVDLTKDIKVFASRFHFRSVENGEDLTDKTVFVDNIGFYTDMNTATDYIYVPKPLVPEPTVEGTATHKDNVYVGNSGYGITDATVSTYAPVHTSSNAVIQSLSCEPIAPTDFFEGYVPTWDFDGEDLGWQAHTSWPFDVSASTEHAYSGSSMKLVYNMGETAYSPRTICSKYTVNVAGNDGIIAWVYSENDITLNCIGIMNNCGKTNQLAVTVKAGGQIVLFPFSEFAAYDAFRGNTKTITQLQFSVSNAVDGTTVYIDNVGFYKNSEITPTNENAYGSIGKSIKISTIGGQKTVADKIYRFDVDFKSDLTDLSGNKWGEEAVLAIWIKTNHAFNLKVGAGASTKWDPATGKNHWFSDSHTVPVGESIIRIPLSEIKNKSAWPYTQETPDWSEYIGRLIFNIATLNDVELEMYVDQIALEYPVEEVVTNPAYLEDDAYIWWNFDANESYADLGGDWEAHWAGETGEGVKVDINKDSANSYKGEGNSLKVDYDTALAEWGSPTVWHEKEMTVYGDGITFWLKSPEKMAVSIVMIAINDENKWIAIQKTDIPVEVGENAISVKYADFVVSGDAEAELPKFSRVTQFQIRFKNGTFGTAYLDSLGFTGVQDDGSNEYKALNPPASYDSFENGVSVLGENFENRKEDDLDFCTDWYYENAGWVSLEKINGNTMLRMDYDMTEKASALKSIQYYEGVDPNGGISFYLKSSENRKFGIQLTIGNEIIKVVIDGTTEGRYYNIPFSAFWYNKNIKLNYEPSSSSLETVKRIDFYTDSIYNPPSVGASKKCSVWLDDIKFVDSLAYKRATDIDYTENGIRLIASEDAFASGVSPAVTVIGLSPAQKADYISKMRNVVSIYKEVSVKTLSSTGIDLIPQRQVELVFDTPSGVDVANVSVWQKYFDGSVFKLNAKVGEDGKLHLLTYRLGNFVIAYGNGEIKNPDDNANIENNNSSVDNGNIDSSDVNDSVSSDVGNTDSSDVDNTDTSSNDQTSSDDNSATFPIIWVIVGGAVALAAAGVVVFACIKVRRTQNGK